MADRGDSADTRKEILDAAYDLFLEKGIDRTSTQKIADKAGVNKAMLYYYFDSKDRLFQEIFRKALRKSGLTKIEILEEDIPLLDKIRKYIDAVIDVFIEHPELSSFVIRELSQRPKLLSEIAAEEINYNPSKLKQQIDRAADNYEIARIDPSQLLMNITSLCLFPATDRKFYIMLLNFNNEDEYEDFLIERKGVVYDMVISWLTT